MNSSDLVTILAASSDLTKADARKAVEGIFAAIGDAAARGEDVSINNFGKFAVKKTPAREGRNPSTGEPISIKAATRISFRAGKLLKDKLNGQTA